MYTSAAGAHDIRSARLTLTKRTTDPGYSVHKAVAETRSVCSAENDWVTHLQYAAMAICSQLYNTLRSHWFLQMFTPHHESEVSSDVLLCKLVA